MSFDVEAAAVSQCGQREHNEDAAAVALPESEQDPHGLIAAVADGVSAGGRGREAAQTAVRHLLADYRATPATWDTTVALDRLISAHNTWLADHNRRRNAYQERSPHDGGGTAMTTLTALVLRGQTYTVAHVGDCRAYLIRENRCHPLTEDHRLAHLDFSSGLTRAIGLDDHVHVDYQQGELTVGDTFVIVCDGIHQSLTTQRIRQLAQTGSAQDAAQALAQAALDAGSRDNLSAVVVRVRGLAGAQLEDTLVRGRRLPIPPRLREGDDLDGLEVETCAASNGVHRIYKVIDRRGRAYALKTLHESRANDAQERAMLAHESWLGLRLTERDPRGFAPAVEPREPSAFYLLHEWIDGQTLRSHMHGRHNFTVPDIVDGALQCCRALARLHRLNVIHRDIKPDNLHLGRDGQWRILDLGVALSGLESAEMRALHAGTPSYINPEQWADEPADAQSDLFALGVTLYEWLTGKLPYGEIEPYQGGRYRRDPVAPSRLRPDVPIWLDLIVLKAVACDKKLRFETADEFALALERGASRPLAAPGGAPLMSRDPAALFKLALGISATLNLLLIYWLLFLPK
ncbi:protein kinase [Aquabacterium sp.]|uniref:protein kinase domain-containing protein n=1 Tax=Aquabacterium sp. TaxID=1872578 RepID=UPI0035B00990